MFVWTASVGGVHVLRAQKAVSSALSSTLDGVHELRAWTQVLSAVSHVTAAGSGGNGPSL